MAQLFFPPYTTVVDTNGSPISGAKLYFYATGTTTPQEVYTTAALSTPHSSPVEADGAGRVPAIYLSPSLVYRCKVFDASDVLIRDTDPVNDTFIASLAASGGSASVGFVASGAGAATRTVQDKLRDLPTVQDFGAVGDGAADDTAAFNAAAALGKAVRIPATSANYKLTNEITLTSGTRFIGDGSPLIKQVTSGKRALVGLNIKRVALEGFRLQGVGSSTAFTSGADDGLINITSTSLGGSANVRIRDVEVWDGKSGIACTRVDGLWIENCRVHDFLLYGVLASSSTDFHISNNTITDSDQAGAANSYGIMATGNTGAGYSQKRCTITGNTISGVPAWDGIMTHEVDRLLIQGNVIEDVRTGIDVGTQSGTLINDVAIIGNTVKLTTTNTWGASGATTGGILVSGNGAGSAMKGFTISGNIVENANQITGAVQAGNLSAGIGLENAGDAVITGNVIRNTGSAISGFNGIHVYTPKDNIAVTGNSVSGTLDGYCVRIEHANGADSCAGLTITSNPFNTTASATLHTLFNKGSFNGLIWLGNSTNTTSKVYGTLNSPTIVWGVSPTIRGAATFDPTNLAAGASTTATVTVTGAEIGDMVTGVGFSLARSGVRIVDAEVTATDTVTVTVQNSTGGSIDLASGTLRVAVLKQ